MNRRDGIDGINGKMIIINKNIKTPLETQRKPRVTMKKRNDYEGRFISPKITTTYLSKIISKLVKTNLPTVRLENE